jgi:hypothetical protein
MKVLTPDADSGAHLHPLDPCDSDGPSENRCPITAEQKKVLAERRSDMEFWWVQRNEPEKPSNPRFGETRDRTGDIGDSLRSRLNNEQS